MDRTIDEFSKQLASISPTPGGGGACGLVGGIAASLASMVTNLTTGKKKYAEYEDEIQKIMKTSEHLRITLLECIKLDALNFEPLAKAYALDKNSPGYEEKMEDCLKLATSTPYEILKLSCEVIELDHRLASIGSKLAISDAATSAMMAYGTIYGAAINVKVNTRLMKDKEYKDKLETEVDLLVNKYSNKALEAYKLVEDRLNG